MPMRLDDMDDNSRRRDPCDGPVGSETSVPLKLRWVGWGQDLETKCLELTNTIS